MIEQNRKSILILGPPGTGKTFCLKELIQKHGDKVAYINNDGKTRLPFKGKKNIAKFIVPADPLEVNPGARALEEMPEIEYIVIDTLSYWMDALEQKHVIFSPDSRGAWGSIYAAEIKSLLHFANNVSKKTWIFLSHTQEGEPKNMVIPTKCYGKGAVGKLGVESAFDTVLYTDVFEDNTKEDGVGYRFQVRKTKDSRGLSVRSPDGMFPEVYTKDNDILKVFEAIDAFDDE